MITNPFNTKQARTNSSSSNQSTTVKQDETSAIKTNTVAKKVQAQTKTDIQLLEEKLASANNLPKDLKERANALILRLKKMSLSGSYSAEYEPISEYINWIVQIPWGQYTKDNLDINHAKESLTKHHYGLEPVKQRILQYLAVIKLQNEKAIQDSQDIQNKQNTQASSSDAMKTLKGNSANAPILCFVGIQGVGKTSMAKSIALALNRQFMRISLGGLGSVAEIRGRARGTVDPEPGQIIKSLIRTNAMNPLILLDEVDKVSSDTGLRSDVMAALLEILDPEQNSTFIDKYLDYPVDLSKCMFICTANNLGGISAALLDRLEIIRFGSYTDDEKVVIAKKYLLPKVRKATGITEKQLSFSDDVWPLVIRPLGFDAGVRQLERTLTELARKIALMIVQGTTKGVKITKDNFRQFIPEDIGVYS